MLKGASGEKWNLTRRQAHAAALAAVLVDHQRTQPWEGGRGGCRVAGCEFPFKVSCHAGSLSGNGTRRIIMYTASAESDSETPTRS